MSLTPVLADVSTSISELKKNPMAIIREGAGMPVAVLNHNKPAFYCIPAEAYEALMEKLDDYELAQLVEARAGQKEIAVTLDEL